MADLESQRHEILLGGKDLIHLRTTMTWRHTVEGDILMQWRRLHATFAEVHQEAAKMFEEDMLPERSLFSPAQAKQIIATVKEFSEEFKDILQLIA